MKQTISSDQLMELTEEQKNKLRDSWEPKVGDWVLYNNEKCLITDKDDYEFYIWNNSASKDEFIPLLSIGQMIEIIENVTGVYPDNKRYTEGSEIYVLVDFKYDNVYDIDRNGAELWEVKHIKQYAYELVDVLWAAVKSIL